MKSVIAMRERPILFSGPMVRAIIDGRKTMTRRVVMPQCQRYNLDLLQPDKVMYPWPNDSDFGDVSRPIRCPYGRPSDLLWVRETFAYLYESGFSVDPKSIIYRSDGDQASYRIDGEAGDFSPHWRPSIHMPRWASRLTLRITEIRVERLQDITPRDARAEGVVPRCEAKNQTDHLTHDIACHIEAFHSLWDDINFKRGYSWDSNPWVWVVSFEKVKP